MAAIFQNGWLYEAKCPQTLPNAHTLSHIKSQQHRSITFGVIAKNVKLP